MKKYQDDPEIFTQKLMCLINQLKSLSTGDDLFSDFTFENKQVGIIGKSLHYLFSLFSR